MKKIVIGALIAVGLLGLHEHGFAQSLKPPATIAVQVTKDAPPWPQATRPVEITWREVEQTSKKKLLCYLLKYGADSSKRSVMDNGTLTRAVIAVPSSQTGLYVEVTAQFNEQGVIKEEPVNKKDLVISLQND
ncbi:hypothetical protein HGA64_02535 [Candidatus Falkowbacteria bacterium]|nr:hypothetical protein [Candidatus Falkowbacteria bacterium]